MKFNVQYSFPTDTRIAVSDWREGNKTIEANSATEAIKKANKLCDSLGTWMILDCWEI